MADARAGMQAALRARDKSGLLPQQQQVLQQLLSAHSWQEVAQRLGLGPNQLTRWLREDAQFRAVYDRIFSTDTENVRRHIEASAGKAADALDAALDATRLISVEIECPECGHTFDYEAPAPNWTARLRAAETVLKVGRVLKDVKKIEGEVLHLTLPQKLGLAMIKRGQDAMVPDAIKEELREMKLLGVGEQEQRDDDAVDAVFTVMEEESDATDPGN